MPGPIPKRTTERRRRNKPDVEVITAKSEPVGLDWPEPDPEWETVTVRWYRSLALGGMAQFYEDSDVAQGFVLAEVLHRALNGAGQRNVGVKGMSGQLLAAWLAGASELGTTEGARRRLRIELERGIPEADPALPILARYRAIQGGQV